MLLFSPSPGQIADRMHILSLKIFAYQERGTNDSALRLEHSKCVQALDKEVAQLSAEKQMDFERLSTQLEQQNADLWSSEHEERKMAKTLSDTPPSYAELQNFLVLRMKSQRGNENRALLVAAIDQLFDSLIE